MRNIIEAKNLSFTYSANTPFEKAAVKNASFCIAEGDYIGVIGHTGSGKSTLIQMLNGLLMPSAGEVLVGGRPVWEKKKCRRDVRFTVGLCFQYPEYQLFEETVYADIAYGPRNKGLPEEEIDRCVREAARLCGVGDELLQRSPFELSGGQKRRVAIAGVMAMEPEVLILDEPTAGLDPRGRDEILARIREYRQEKGKTIVLVSHSMEDISANAQKIMVLSRGEIRFFDETKRVFEHARELEEIGLGVPSVTRIFQMLRARGVDVPGNVYTLSDATRVLAERLKGGGRDA